MRSCQALVAFLATVFVVGIVFGLTGRLAVRQVTHDNMDAVKILAGDFITNSLPDDKSDIGAFTVKLYKRIALSPVRENWEEVCSMALWIGIISGITALIVARRGKTSSKD